MRREKKQHEKIVLGTLLLWGALLCIRLVYWVLPMWMYRQII